MGGDVWLVIGVQASGKSTVADLLARRFDRGVHLQGGQFYRWAVRGWVHHDDADRSQARRHLELRYRLSAMAADEYCASGFSTVVQDNIYGPDVVAWLGSVRARPRHLVVLRPTLEVVAQRDADRTAAAGKVAYKIGGDTIASLDAQLADTPRLGLWLDTSEMSPEDVVDSIVAQEDRAAIDAHI
jgi:cytidylate kinase